MCQMLNIWHISHTKHQKLNLSNVPNLKNFATCEQYHCKFATVRTKNGIIFIVFLFYFLSPLSSVYSFLFSLTSIFYEEWYKFAPILFSLTPSLISHRLHFASSPPISLGIVIVIADQNRCGHRRWGEIGIDVEVRSECSSRSWASTLRSWSWASRLRWGEILIVGCWC